MKNINKLAIFLIIMTFIIGCSNNEADVKSFSQVIKVQLKAVFEEFGEDFHLYVTINEEVDYYAGGYWPGANFELNENSYVKDAPKDSLVTLSTLWTGEGQWFYVYQKSDTELAVMNRPVGYSDWMQSALREHFGDEEYEKQYTQYKEVLVIPIEKGSQIQIEDLIIIQKPEGGTVG